MIAATLRTVLTGPGAGRDALRAVQYGNNIVLSWSIVFVAFRLFADVGIPDADIANAYNAGLRFWCVLWLTSTSFRWMFQR